MPRSFRAPAIWSIRQHIASWRGTNTSSLRKHVTSDPFSGNAPITIDPPEPEVAPVAVPKKGPRHRQVKKHSPARNLVEWVLIIAAALLVALVIKQFLIQAFYIPSESMEETLHVRDRV